MRKRLLALLMAMVMVFGLNATYLAAGDSPSTNNKQEVGEIKVTLDQSNWSVTAEAYTGIEEGVPLQYTAYLYKDGKLVREYFMVQFSGQETPVNFNIFSRTIEENGAGKYAAEVVVTTFIDDKVLASGKSAEVEYKLPDAKLDTIKASVENGVLTFDMVEGAAFYNVKATYTAYGTGGSYEAYYLNENIFTEDFYMKDNDIVKYVNDGKSISLDFAKFVKDREAKRKENYPDYPGQEYDFTLYVYAQTPDMNKVQSSDVTKAGTYVYRLSDEQVKQKLDALTEEVIKADPVDAKIQIAGLTQETLVGLMKDAAFVKKVALIEDALLNMEGSKYLKPTAASTSASVDGTKISIVGALMNVGEGVQATLSVADAKGVTAPSGYFNAVALDIKLFAGETSLTNLDVPVQITMPIPTGVAKENLVILHYHEEGKDPQVITPVVNADGTMTFAVTGFSTFVVANTVADGTGDTDPVGALVAVMALSAVVAVVAIKKKSVVK